MGSVRTAVGPVAVLVPVKPFGEAKLRLAPALSPDDRSRLARDMATHVVSAAGVLPVAVVCDDVGVADWARRLGALVLWQPEQGINQAVQGGVGRLEALGATRVIVAHADLPLAGDLGWVADFDGVTIVPDRREDGTNVICVPTGSGFSFSYGPGSLARHVSEVRRLELGLRLACEPTLAHDVDLPLDLDRLDLDVAFGAARR